MVEKISKMRKKAAAGPNGFIKEHLIDLHNAALNQNKMENGWIFTIEDISKAFDTIPHPALAPFLGRKGVPAPIIELINNMYMDSKQLLELMEKRGSKSRFSEE
jgi:hypothetical protein